MKQEELIKESSYVVKKGKILRAKQVTKLEKYFEIALPGSEKTTMYPTGKPAEPGPSICGRLHWVLTIFTDSSVGKPTSGGLRYSRAPDRSNPTWATRITTSTTTLPTRLSTGCETRKRSRPTVRSSCIIHRAPRILRIIRRKNGSPNTREGSIKVGTKYARKLSRDR